MELWSAFLLGLAGSLHCAGMCGPLALALPAAGVSRTPFILGRLAYNVGRIVTYSLMGVVFGLVGRTVWLSGFQQAMSITLGVLLLAGLLASRRLALWQPVNSLVNRIKSPLSALLRRKNVPAQFLLGLLNGFLPCGLVYVACAGATVTGDPLRGALYMVLFGVGTFPMMLAIGLSGKLIPFKLRLKLLKAVPASVFVLAMLLILRGLSLGIPYISPDLSAAHPSCCQP